MALDASEAGVAAPGVTPPGGPMGLWGAYRTARRNVLELIPAEAYRAPVVAGGRNPGWIMLTDPPALERVLKTRVEAYPKSGVLKRLMRPRKGTNLVVTEGREWLWRRRAMSKPFTHAAALANDAPMTAAAEAAARRIAAAAPGDRKSVV